MTIDEYILYSGLQERTSDLKHLNIAWASTRVDSADEDEGDVEDDAYYYAEGEEYLMKQDLKEEELVELEEMARMEEEEEEEEEYREGTYDETWYDLVCGERPRIFNFLANLTTLELHGCRDETAFDILKRALFKSNLPKLTSLKVANYDEVMTTPDCIEILDAILTGNLQGVKSLDISGNYIHAEAMPKLFQVIPRLSYLNVAYNYFDDEEIAELKAAGEKCGCRVKSKWG